MAANKLIQQPDILNLDSLGAFDSYRRREGGYDNRGLSF